MNPHASALGKLAKGIAKTLSDDERKRRAEWARTLAETRSTPRRRRKVKR